jgi:nicotinate-nucleotide adenylyltransferase
MRVGIFGGTFDPVHLGHLIVAEQCREQARLDEVWFVPAPRPPQKLERIITPFDRRVEMLALAVAGHSAFKVDELERDRPGPSYTVDTLEQVHREHAGTGFFLILGADAVVDLPTWREPRRVIELATLVIVARPGWSPMPAEQLRAALRLPDDVPLRQQVVSVPLVEISSSDLRRRVAQGRSIRYLVPRAVQSYIEGHRLYREDVSGS